jgi:HSP20 family molecular chaperone IbpA
MLLALRELEKMFDLDYNYSYRNTEQYTHVTNDKEVVIEMAVPGITREDLKVDVMDNVLIVEAKTKSKSRLSKDLNYRWYLDKNIDVDNINATLTNGLLTLTLPKVKPAKKTIAVAVS